MDEGKLYLSRYTAFHRDRLATRTRSISDRELYLADPERRATESVPRKPAPSRIYRVSECRIESPFSLVSRASGRAIRPRNVNVRFPVFSRMGGMGGQSTGWQREWFDRTVSSRLARENESSSSAGILTISSWFEGLTDVCPPPIRNNGITGGRYFSFFFKFFLSNWIVDVRFGSVRPFSRFISCRISWKLKIKSDRIIFDDSNMKMISLDL